MQNTISIRSGAGRDSKLRRSSIMTIVYLTAIILVCAAGLWLLLSHGSRVGFYGSIAAASLMADPLRRHLTTLLP